MQWSPDQFSPWTYEPQNEMGSDEEGYGYAQQDDSEKIGDLLGDIKTYEDKIAKVVANKEIKAGK